MRLHFLHLYYLYILLLTISLLPFGSSFVCPDGTRALCCLTNPFANPKANRVYLRCKLWLEYFNKPECRDSEDHLCCEIYLANGIGKRCRKATAADSCPAFYPPTLGPKPDDLGPGGGGSNPGDGGSPGDGHGSSSPKDGLLPGGDGFSPDDDPPNPDNKPGNDDGEEDGPWRPKRPPGLWKAKKVRRRDCDSAGAGVGLPLTSKSSSLLSEDGDGNEHVVAAMADNTEEGDPVVAAAVGKGYEDTMGGDSAFLESPGQGSIHDSSLDLDLAASGLEGEGFFKQTPAEDK